MSKSSDLRSNQIIREAIQKIALHGLVDPHTNSVHGTGRTTGFVKKIHTDEDDELFGTVDVQEYSSIAHEANSDEVQIGYHEGVLISALQDNSKGMVIIPKLYSEVVIAEDPVTHTEYVAMFSHVDVIQLDSHDTITVGVTEREEFNESDEESPDVEELEETGVYTKTTYKKNSIVTEVQDESDSDKVKQTIDGKQFNVVVGDNDSSQTMNQDKIEFKHGDGSSTMTDDDIVHKMGSSKVKIEDGTVYVGSDSGTDDAVLGVELANVLDELLGYIGQIMTTTMLGPQPPINVASFIALKAKIASFKGAHSGFLTKKVQIQK